MWKHPGTDSVIFTAGSKGNGEGGCAIARSTGPIRLACPQPRDLFQRHQRITVMAFTMSYDVTPPPARWKIAPTVIAQKKQALQHARKHKSLRTQAQALFEPALAQSSEVRHPLRQWTCRKTARYCLFYPRKMQRHRAPTGYRLADHVLAPCGNAGPRETMPSAILRQIGRQSTVEIAKSFIGYAAIQEGTSESCLEINGACRAKH